MKYRIIYGHLTIIGAMTAAVLGTMLLDYLETITSHPFRMQQIFLWGGMVLGIASLFVAVMFYTNNMGEGFKEN